VAYIGGGAVVLLPPPWEFQGARGLLENAKLKGNKLKKSNI